jgi:peroxiredoxin
VIAVSPEAAPDSVDNASAAGPTFPVLIDHGGKVAEQFGLTFEMDDAAKNVLKGSGIDLEKRNAGGKWILPVPGTFVIDRSGMSMQTIATGLNRRRSSRCVGHYGASQ